MDRLMCLSDSQNQIILRFVMMMLPRSPLLPLVSSTWFMESTIYSPSNNASCDMAMSKRISRSCHINLASSVFFSTVYFDI